MESIGSILGKAIPASPQVPDSEKQIPKTEYTPDEAKEAGLFWDREPPVPVKCEHCGKILYHLGIAFQRKIMIWHPFPQRCDCPEAVKYWQDYDAEQERQKRLEEEAEARRRNGKCYKCTGCDAYVGIHTGTKIPLGRLANKELREMKKQCHALFDPAWKGNKNLNRDKAYKRLAARLCIPLRECHFGWFDKTMLTKCLEILSNPKWYKGDGNDEK